MLLSIFYFQLFFCFQGIRVVQKVSIKKQKSQVIGVAWFENNIYICDGNRRIFIVSDKAPFNETEGEISLQTVIDPTDMVICKADRCIYISDGRRACVHRIKLTDNSNRYPINQVKFSMRGIPRRLSVTPSGRLLVVMTDCCSSETWFIEETDSDNVAFKHLLHLEFNIHAVDHAVKIPSGNVVMSYTTQSFNTSPYLIGEMSVQGRNFLWEIDIRSLPRLQRWLFSSQIFVRDDGEIFFAGVSDNGEEYRNHVFRLNPVDKQLEELVSAKQDLDHPMRFSFGEDEQQLVICRVEGSLIYSCISKSSF